MPSPSVIAVVCWWWPRRWGCLLWHWWWWGHRDCCWCCCDYWYPWRWWWGGRGNSTRVWRRVHNHELRRQGYLHIVCKSYSGITEKSLTVTEKSRALLDIFVCFWYRWRRRESSPAPWGPNRAESCTSRWSSLIVLPQTLQAFLNVSWQNILKK